MNIYFSDFFNVDEDSLSDYGAFNVSLINDLPVFIDPFLLFSSQKPEYQQLHREIIEYLTFLRDVSEKEGISQGLQKHWFLFPEVKQNWLGYSKVGNGGSGLGSKFAVALNTNLGNIFNNFGHEQITQSSHLEKLCLINEGVGKDCISDFTTNLIKGYLCQYTEQFAQKYIEHNRCKTVSVPHAKFDYHTRRWLPGTYKLPYIDNDFVLLTPKDILTKDEAWINKHDIVGEFDEIAMSIPNDELRSQVNDYLLRQIPDNATQKETNQAIFQTLKSFPELIDYYIRYKELNKATAESFSDKKLKEVEKIFIRKVVNLVEILRHKEGFYDNLEGTFEATYKRVVFLKQVIESNDGYKIFYLNGQPIKRESDLQLIFKLTWFASQEDVNAEVNNGRGPVDFKISRGSKDSTLVEFKLASNSKLKQNLAKQVEVYQQANQTRQAIKVILFFSDKEHFKVIKILKELGLKEGKELVLIDARDTNKESASNVKLF